MSAGVLIIKAFEESSYCLPRALGLTVSHSSLFALAYETFRIWTEQWDFEIKRLWEVETTKKNNEASVLRSRNLFYSNKLRLDKK